MAYSAPQPYTCTPLENIPSARPYCTRRMQFQTTYRTRKPTRGYQGSIGVQNNANEARMHVRGNINDIPDMTLVDIGAIVTIVSRKKFENMDKKCKIE